MWKIVKVYEEYMHENFDWFLLVLAFLAGSVTRSFDLKWYYEFPAWVIQLSLFLFLLNGWKGSKLKEIKE